MGTSIEVELHAPSRSEAEVAIGAVMAEMHRIDAAMSPHKADSELSRINASAAAAPVALSDEMFALVPKQPAEHKEQASPLSQMAEVVRIGLSRPMRGIIGKRLTYRSAH